MSRPGPEVRLSTEEREILLRWMRNSKTEQRMVERARAILLAASGLSGKEVAVKMKTRNSAASSEKTVRSGLRPAADCDFGDRSSEREQVAGEPVLLSFRLARFRSIGSIRRAFDTSDDWSGVMVCFIIHHYSDDETRHLAK
jgi:hypothetical protein